MVFSSSKYRPPLIVLPYREGLGV
ncbi:hypothetical protein RSAG8_04503, partial [Rhizoctonia solani AG-8 WAC10335]